MRTTIILLCVITLAGCKSRMTERRIDGSVYGGRPPLDTNTYNNYSIYEPIPTRFPKSFNLYPSNVLSAPIQSLSYPIPLSINEIGRTEIVYFNTVSDTYKKDSICFQWKVVNADTVTINNVLVANDSGRSYIFAPHIYPKKFTLRAVGKKDEVSRKIVFDTTLYLDTTRQQPQKQ